MRLIEILVVEQRIDESIAILEVSVVVHKLVLLVGLIVLQVDSLEPFQDGQLGGRVHIGFDLGKLEFLGVVPKVANDLIEQDYPALQVHHSVVFFVGASHVLEGGVLEYCVELVLRQ